MEGRFCTKCGAPAGEAHSSAPAPAMPGPVESAKKTTSPLVWVLVGCLGLVVVVGVLITAGGFFVASKVKQAHGNPALAIAKIMAAANKGIEIVSSDDAAGTVTFRDKKTGKTVTLDLEELKKGHISFEGEDREKIDINAQGKGKEGTVSVKTKEGTVKFGAGGAVNLPSWIPNYPGSSPEGDVSAQGANGVTGSFSFKTGDTPDKVADFYVQAFNREGLKADKNQTEQNGKTVSVVVMGKDDGREVTMSVAVDAGATRVTVSYSSQ